MHQIPNRLASNYQNDPQYTNLPSELTIDGIRQLFVNSSNSGTSASQQYILQIIKIVQDYSQNRMCHLSDGYCYVSCLLTGQAKLKNIKGQLQVFDVVKLSKEDVIILGLQRSPALQLCNLKILGMRLLCSIGEPVAYMTYHHNDYVNRRGSVLIADGQKIQNALNISQLVENFPHVPTKWILKAKVFKKPININPNKPMMIIQLMDQKQAIIQGVFFGQVALDSHKKLSQKRWYLFNNGQIKSKKNNVQQLQIKFTQQSQIIPIETMKSTYQTNMGDGSSQQLTIKDVNINDGRLVTIVGKVFKIKKLSRGRSMQILDKNSDVIEIVLWEQINDQVKEGITYIFQNLRTKQYNSVVSLQSVRSKTSVKRSPVQIEKTNSAQSNVVNKKFQNKFSMVKCKQLRQPNNLVNVRELVGLNITQRQYKDVTGYLMINTMYMDIKNFFKLECPNCPNNSHQITADPLICKKCSATNPSIRWNIRCQIIDQRQEIKCIMNEDLCQNILKMSSIQGFKKLTYDKEGMRRKVQEISHLEGIFKIKVNPYKDNLYYNIVDIYRNDSKILLNKAYKQLKLALEKFKQA